MKTLIKNIGIYLLCTIASFAAQAQGTIVWEKPIFIPHGQEMKTAAQSRDGQFWVGVSEADSKPTDTLAWIPKSSVFAFDANTGDTLWYKRFYPQYKLESTGWGVAKAPNGQFWVVIRFVWKQVTPNSTGIGLFRMDSLGNILEHKELMVGCHSFKRQAVYSQPDGGVLIVGHVLRKINCTQWDLFAIRLDGQGNELWSNVYEKPYDQTILSAGLYPGNKLCMGYYDGNTSYQNRMAFVDIATGALLYSKNTPSGAGRRNLRCYPMRDGSFIVGGSTNSNNNVGYLARTDANFNILWEKTDNNATIYGDHLEETFDSCVVVSSSNYDSNGNLKRFMAKRSLKTGEELWRTYHTTSTGTNPNPGILDLAIGYDEDLYALGYSNGDFYAARYTGVADFLQPSDYCSDSLRANFTGTWQNDTLRLRSISNSGMAHQDSVDCQWLIGGNTVSLDTALQQTISMQANPEGVNVTLVITNFWGCKDTLIARVLPNGTITGNRPVNTHGGAYLKNAYPNPSAQNVSIGYTLPAKTENAILRVYELGTGRTVAERNLPALDSEIKFNVSGWATGVYAYQLYVNGVPVAVKKMVVSR